MREEKPLGVLDEGGRQTADGENEGADDASETVASVTEAADEGD